jgi:hypothetical protein
MKTRNVTILILFAAVILLAQQPRFDYRVRQDFFAGLTGDNAALERGMKTCEMVLASDPKAAEALVWHGVGLFVQSGKLFKSGDAAKGSDLFGRALKEMQQAREIAPENLGVLIPAGSALLAGTRAMPPGASTRDLLLQGLADYEKVYDLQKSYFDTLSGHQRGELLFGMAEGYARAGDTEKARVYFEKLSVVGPGSGHAAQTQTWLETGKIDSSKAHCVGCHVK